MVIGRPDEGQQSSVDHGHINAAEVFGCHSRNPSGPAAMMPHQKADGVKAPRYRAKSRLRWLWAEAQNVGKGCSHEQGIVFC
jgi:hypothetical protein